jgi:tRNA threonylcarbamoyladenosine biosynthesis protein TsaE
MASMATFFHKQLQNEEATKNLGAKLFPILRCGDFIGLTGELGAGKTSLARGLIQAFMGEAIDVPSPTFTLVQIYTQTANTTINSNDTPTPIDLFHFDLYRLKNSDEVWELGWEDISAGVALVEWPDRAGDYLPANCLNIHMSFAGNGRIAQFSALHEEYWKDRLNGV